MVKPIIPWIGGKRKLAPKILPLFPEHTCYMEQSVCDLPTPAVEEENDLDQFRLILINVKFSLGVGRGNTFKELNSEDYINDLRSSWSADLGRSKMSALEGHFSHHLTVYGGYEVKRFLTATIFLVVCVPAFPAISVDPNLESLIQATPTGDQVTLSNTHGNLVADANLDGSSVTRFTDTHGRTSLVTHDPSLNRTIVRYQTCTVIIDGSGVVLNDLYANTGRGNPMACSYLEMNASDYLDFTEEEFSTPSKSSVIADPALLTAAWQDPNLEGMFGCAGTAIIATVIVGTSAYAISIASIATSGFALTMYWSGWLGATAFAYDQVRSACWA